MTIRRSTVAGIGHALPKRVVTNAELAAKIDTSDEWIVERTGIRQRHIAGEGETTATLATEAAQKALSHAGLKASDIDLIVLATATPDYTFPATARKCRPRSGLPMALHLTFKRCAPALFMRRRLPTNFCNRVRTSAPS